ncbi:MAG: GTP 3',8-cyclase MoaA [Chloroflexi bacterium]|nr:GTP 3',8-cyclase MoaA [Chloroflexota bacterium]
MIDRFGRSIDYLRLSVTERCTLRCTYCRVEEGICPKAQELTAGEFERIGKTCARLGIRKVRITGGEPLLRKDILEIVHRLAAVDGIEEITMTTNAQQLAGRVGALKAAGLQRLNISLDTLDPDKYREMTGGELSTVLSAIDEAIEAQLLPVKINTVIIKGTNDDEVDDLMALAKARPVEVRFIELMPVGELGQNDELRVNNDDLIAARPYLRPLPPRYAGQPARDYAVDGYKGRVGFISPLSHKFCASCNRIRVMSDGKIRPCLGSNLEVETKDALAQGDAALLETMRNAIYHKPVAHHFNTGFISLKNMSRIGG